MAISEEQPILVGNGDQRISTQSQDNSPSETLARKASAQRRATLVEANLERNRKCQWAVHMPKFVMLDQDRLALLSYFLSGLLLLFILWYFLVNSQYSIVKKPSAKVYLCTDGALCQPSLAEMETHYFDAHNTVLCQNTSRFEYWYSNHTKYMPSGVLSAMPYGCRRPCSIQGNDKDRNSTNTHDGCMRPKDAIKVQPDMVFVPTYTTEVVHTQGANGTCPKGFTMKQTGVCTQEKQLFIPGADKQRINFAHSFSASPELGIKQLGLLMKDKYASSFSSDSEGWGDGIKTVFFDHAGNKVHEWAPGARINPSVEELLKAADYTDVGVVGDLSLDQQYTSLASGEPSDVVPSNLKPQSMNCKPEDCGASLRMTGVSVTVDLGITDTGKCYHIKLKEDFKVEHDGPVACMFTHAQRTWVNQGDTQQIGLDGTYKTTVESGVRIKFRTKGEIRLFDVSIVSQNITVAIIWIQIPLMIVYYFAVFCLGRLSTVYSNCICENVNLGDACKGLATRLLSHSAAYMDLQNRPEGISKKRLLERFRSILEHQENIDDREIEKYVDFVFEGMQAMGEHEDGSQLDDTVNIQEFCTACSTNEPLNFQSMVMLFDKDRELSVLEDFFLDDNIRGVLNAAKAETEDVIAAEEPDVTKEDMAVMGVVGGRVGEMEIMSEQILKSYQDTASEGSTLAERLHSIAKARQHAGIGVMTTFADIIPTEDPKPDQRESDCSIAEEDDPGFPARS